MGNCRDLLGVYLTMNAHKYFVVCRASLSDRQMLKSPCLPLKVEFVKEVGIDIRVQV